MDRHRCGGMGVVFGWIITQVLYARVPCDIKCSLRYLDTDPKVVYVHGVQPLLLDHDVGNIDSGRVVTMDGCW
eukprot:14736048-Ditylum_brightwellii.AAC.1